LFVVVWGGSSWGALGDIVDQNANSLNQGANSLNAYFEKSMVMAIDF
jgi:hypothetical protein